MINLDWVNVKEMRSKPTDVDTDLYGYTIVFFLTDANGFDDFFDTFSFANRKKIAVTGPDKSTQLKVENFNFDFSSRKGWLKVRIPWTMQTNGTYLYFWYDLSKSDNTTNIGDVGEAPAQEVHRESVLTLNFSEDPTSAITDSTPESNDGTNNGLVTGDWVNANIGKGIEFGVSKHISIVTPTNIPLESQSYTLEMVFTYHDFSIDYGSGFNGFLFSRGVEVNLNMQNVVITTDGSIWLTHFTQDNDTTFNISTEVEYRLAVTYDGKFEKLYMDGVLIITLNVGSLSVLDSTIRIGRHAVDNSFWCDAQIDEVSLSHGVKSAEMIKADNKMYSDDLIDYSPTPQLENSNRSSSGLVRPNITPGFF